jgi:hypothetical protein
VTHFEVIVALLAGIGTLVSMCGLGIRWVFKEGASSEQLRQAVDQNTRATNDLSLNYKVFTLKIADQMVDHEKRLTRLETTTELQRSKDM